MTDRPVPKTTLDHATDPARDWVRILARYRTARSARSAFELSVTVVPLVVLWVLAVLASAVHPLLAIALSLSNALFLVRLFAIQHDCGHGAFFADRRVNDWVGRCLGVVTLTPYAVWRRSHSVHHSATGNLERRGIGDVHTLTVREYCALSPRGRLGYRAYRNPLVMLGLFPTYLFWIQNRFPATLTEQGWRPWASAMGTNLALFTLLASAVAAFGWTTVLMAFGPTTIAAATIGMWLFYIQHQFEETSWDRTDDWRIHDAALHGSSHYDLPPVLGWLTANIGIHHVHHLHARIPFYRLPEVLDDHPALADIRRISFTESIGCLRLKLWDERTRRLVPFDAVTHADFRSARSGSDATMA
ncbi:fatty acid desaturase [uncultured Jannaschia sp.]|uniref:fatty acid desaturase n=1 Tax=uncultured Jannaschia sp. TaxID=293347 RepID=UPI0026376094|nr:fatty acid desaturase [uncultured Jannaschia sp.]